ECGRFPGGQPLEKVYPRTQRGRLSKQLSDLLLGSVTPLPEPLLIGSVGALLEPVVGDSPVPGLFPMMEAVIPGGVMQADGYSINESRHRSTQGGFYVLALLLIAPDLLNTQHLHMGLAVGIHIA